jgi:hypothetical protein
MMADYRLWIALKRPEACPEAMTGQPPGQWSGGVTLAYTATGAWNLIPRCLSKYCAQYIHPWLYRPPPCPPPRPGGFGRGEMAALGTKNRTHTKDQVKEQFMRRLLRRIDRSRQTIPPSRAFL